MLLYYCLCLFVVCLKHLNHVMVHFQTSAHHSPPKIEWESKTIRWFHFDTHACIEKSSLFSAIRMMNLALAMNHTHDTSRRHEIDSCSGKICVHFFYLSPKCFDHADYVLAFQFDKLIVWFNANRSLFLSLFHIEIAVIANPNDSHILLFVWNAKNE